MRPNLPLAASWLRNLCRAHVLQGRLLEPMAVTWHATHRCNLRCAFCDDGRGNCYAEMPEEHAMSTAEAKQVLGLARRKVSTLFVTGGEPLLRRDLEELVAWAKTEAGFAFVGMVTNGLLLRRHEALLDHLDDLAISLHTLDEDRGDELLGAPGATRTIVEAARRYGALARRAGFGFSVSCVARPEQLADAREVMHFCFEHGIAYTVMPQSVGPYPHPRLLDNPEYVALIDDVIAEKRRGQPVYGSLAYYRCIRDFERFRCYPTVNLRIFPAGELIYPCLPLDKSAGSLVGAASLDAVIAEGVARHGGVPICDRRCFASCWVEPAFAIRFPLAVLHENLGLVHRLRRAAS
jgi:MoaA/NifB/PqqE/SkfB family radical SAM enzyme